MRGLGVGGSLAAVIVLGWSAGSALRHEDAAAAFEAPRSGTGVWFVFNPGNCGISTYELSAFNRLSTDSAVHVRGVMLSPPDSEAEGRRVAQAFGIRFPVIYDHHDHWGHLVRRRHYPLPAVVVVRGDGIVAVGSLALVKVLGPLVHE